MTERFQVNLELTGNLRIRFEEAMRALRREKTELMRVMVEDWINAWDMRGRPGWEPVLGGPGPPERPKSGERKRVSR